MRTCLVAVAMLIVFLPACTTVNVLPNPAPTPAPTPVPPPRLPECAICVADSDCVAPLICNAFSDGSRRCASGNGSTTCPSFGRFGANVTPHSTHWRSLSRPTGRVSLRCAPLDSVTLPPLTLLHGVHRRHAQKLDHVLSLRFTPHRLPISRHRRAPLSSEYARLPCFLLCPSPHVCLALCRRGGPSETRTAPRLSRLCRIPPVLPFSSPAPLKALLCSRSSSAASVHPASALALQGRRLAGLALTGTRSTAWRPVHGVHRFRRVPIVPCARTRHRPFETIGRGSR